MALMTDGPPPLWVIPTDNSKFRALLSTHWGELRQGLANLIATLSDFPPSLRLGTHGDRLLLGRLHALSLDESHPESIRSAIRGLIMAEPSLTAFETSVLAVMRPLSQTFGIEPTFKDIDLPYTISALAQAVKSLDRFGTAADAKLGDLVYRLNQSCNTPGPFGQDEIGVGRVAEFSLMADIAPLRPMLDDQDTTEIGLLLMLIHPILTALGVDFHRAEHSGPATLRFPGEGQHQRDLTISGSHRDGVPEETRTSARIPTMHLCREIQEIIRDYRQSIVESNPASISTILAGAKDTLGPEELELLKKELLFVWFASKVEEHAKNLAIK